MKRIGAWWQGLSRRGKVILIVVAALLMLPVELLLVNALVSTLTRRRQRASDDDWNYVPIRRLLLYLEESLDRNLQWVVFEPNDKLLQRTRLLPLRPPPCPRP
jgi:hypothetical protein